MSLEARVRAAVSVAAMMVVACHPPRSAHPLAAANPGATFEVELAGCTSAGSPARRFGSDIRTALLWASERVHTAPYLPCTATIDAVRGDQRRAVYRISRQRDGKYVEEILHATR